MVDETGISKDLSSALLVKNGWHAQSAVNALLKENYIRNEFNFTLEEGAETLKASK